MVDDVHGTTHPARCRAIVCGTYRNAEGKVFK